LLIQPFLFWASESPPRKSSYKVKRMAAKLLIKLLRALTVVDVNRPPFCIRDNGVSYRSPWGLLSL
jgi:hypothetical protein